MRTEIDIRDPATASDPVALVVAHLDAGAGVTVRDSLGIVPTFGLIRHGASVAVLDGEGMSLAVYADVEAALRCGLTRWPAELEAAAVAAIEAAVHPRKPPRRFARMAARFNRSARHVA